MSTPVQVFVRDANLNRIGQIEDFQQLTLNMLYNDVGSWEIVLPADSPGAALLDRVKNPGGGIVVYRNGVQLLTGPARGHKWERSGDTGNGVFTVAGLDDNWPLAAHLIWPDTDNTIDNQQNLWWATFQNNLGLTQSAEMIMYNLVSGQMGPWEAPPSRAIPNLTFGSNFDRGYSQFVPKGWRFNTVLDGLQQMSVLSKNPTTGIPQDELGFIMRQYPATDVQLIQFMVFQSNDRSSTVRFSFNVGNLAEATYNTTAPKATYLITGAGQTSTADSSGVSMNSSLFGWSRADYYYPGFYAEGFQDQSEVDPLDPNAVAQLTQNVNDYWSANGGQVAATFKAIDTTTMAFGTHYMLGDFVTVELPQLTFVERVRAISLSYTPDQGEELTLAVGTSDGTYSRLTSGRASSAMFQRYVATAKRNYEIAQAKARAKAKADHEAHLKHLAHLHTLHMKHLKTLKAKKRRAQPATKRAKK